MRSGATCLNLGTSLGVLPIAAKIPNGTSFRPYARDDDIPVGAFVFEDVGVIAYRGVAPLLTQSSNLTASAGILAVEASHTGLIRTSIHYIDPYGTSIANYTNLISALCATLPGIDLPLNFNSERVRCCICGQRCRLWGNGSGQRMLACAICDVREIDEFLTEWLKQ